MHSHESELNSGKNCTPHSDATNDLDVPIALRKGVKSCTQHPISNFFGYSHLSESVQALATKLSSIEIPKFILEAVYSRVEKSS